MKILLAVMTALTITTSAAAAGPEHLAGLFLGNVLNNDCEQTIRDYKSTAAKGRALLTKQQANPNFGTSDTEPSYMLISGSDVRDTSLVRQGKIIKVEDTSPTETWFFLQGTGSVKQVSKLRLIHVENDRWMLTEYMRGPSMDSLRHIGPTFSTVCKLQ